MIVQKGRFASRAGYVTFNTRADRNILPSLCIYSVYTYATALFTEAQYSSYSIHAIRLQKIVHGPCSPRPALKVQCLTRVCGSTPDD